MVTKKPRALDWFVMATAGLHATQIAIMETFAETGNEPMSPKDLGAAPRVKATLGGAAADLGRVSYHVRMLRDYELLELDHTVPRRGAVQHFYVMPARVMLSARQQSVRALSRSTSRLAGREVPLTADTMTDAFLKTLRERSAVVPDERQVVHVRAAMDELLRGVGGA